MRYGWFLAGLTIIGISGGIFAQPTMKKQEGGDEKPVIATFGPAGVHRKWGGPPPMIMDVSELHTILEEIGIKNQTIDKIVGITRTFIADFERNLIKVRREELDIKEELLKNKPDLAIIRKSITKKSSIFSEIEFAQIKRDLEIKALLTRDEYEKLKSLTEKRIESLMPSMMDKGKQHMPSGREGKRF
ncbi:MAG: hypothetical protein JW863_04300 [Chitinispirillaceae bacterium]|nr:hypothetical protein [Chitinispirillaceae bacterium]